MFQQVSQKRIVYPRLVIVSIRAAHTHMRERLIQLVRDRAYSFDYRSYLAVLCSEIMLTDHDRHFDQPLLDIKTALMNLDPGTSTEPIMTYEEVLRIEHMVSVHLVEALAPYYSLLMELREDRNSGFKGFRVDVLSNSNEARIWLDYYENYMGDGYNTPRV